MEIDDLRKSTLKQQGLVEYEQDKDMMKEENISI